MRVKKAPSDSTQTISEGSEVLAGVSELKPSLLGSAMYSLVGFDKMLATDCHWGDGTTDWLRDHG